VRAQKITKRLISRIGELENALRAANASVPAGETVDDIMCSPNESEPAPSAAVSGQSGSQTRDSSSQHLSEELGPPNGFLLLEEGGEANFLGQSSAPLYISPSVLEVSASCSYFLTSAYVF
jgi:hypothetical protein